MKTSREQETVTSHLVDLKKPNRKCRNESMPDIPKRKIEQVIPNWRRISYLEDNTGETFLTTLLRVKTVENIEERLCDEKEWDLTYLIKVS